MARLEPRRFSQVWVVSFGYRLPPGERPEVFCATAEEIHSGEILSFWREDLARLRRAPYPVGPGALFVCYDAVPTLCCHLALGWELPCRVVDLLIEFRCRINGDAWREREEDRHSLARAAEYFGVSSSGAVENSAVRNLTSRGGLFTAEERRELSASCERRVNIVAEVLARMAPCLPLQALQRGRFACTAARMLHAGIPLDVENLQRLRHYREQLLHSAVSAVDPSFALFFGTDFKPEHMELLVARMGLPWPRHSSGCLQMDTRVWGRMAKRFPSLQPLYEVRRMLDLLPDNAVAAGSDGRTRYTFLPFATVTGRNSWKAAESILAQPTYLRGLIRPGPGKALVYLDYAQQEFAIAAVLSGDGRMMEAYRSGDPYLAFGQQARLIPLHANQETHGTERQRLKGCVLGLQYLISEHGLADQLEIQTDYAKALIEAHRRVYRRFWQWAEGVADAAILDGFQKTLMGWRVNVYSGETLRRGKLVPRFNPRSAVNFPIQGGGADVSRLACNLASERGIPLLANIHDALLVEGDAENINDLAAEVEALMIRAGQELLNGFTLKVSRVIVRHPERLLAGETDRKRWSWLVGQLDRLEAAEMLQECNTRCCTAAT